MIRKWRRFWHPISQGERNVATFLEKEDYTEGY